jgi:two-component system cell cycle response regulator DivK
MVAVFELGRREVAEGGVSALGRLRSDPRTAPIPVVALTAYAMKDDQQRFLQAGFDACVLKPISVRELPTQVRACLETARATEDEE